MVTTPIITWRSNLNIHYIQSVKKSKQELSHDKKSYSEDIILKAWKAWWKVVYHKSFIPNFSISVREIFTKLGIAKSTAERYKTIWQDLGWCIVHNSKKSKDDYYPSTFIAIATDKTFAPLGWVDVAEQEQLNKQRLGYKRLTQCNHPEIPDSSGGGSPSTEGMKNINTKNSSASDSEIGPLNVFQDDKAVLHMLRHTSVGFQREMLKKYTPESLKKSLRAMFDWWRGRIKSKWSPSFQKVKDWVGRELSLVKKLVGELRPYHQEFTSKEIELKNPASEEEIKAFAGNMLNLLV